MPKPLGKQAQEIISLIKMKTKFEQELIKNNLKFEHT